MATHLKGIQKSTMTNQQRKMLCEYKRDQPGCTQNDLVKWVEKSFNLKVSQATISNTLKRSAEFLSSDFEKGGSSKRQKSAKYPDLEKVVYEWFLQHQERVNITGELILEKANEALKLLHPEDPANHRLSQGWLEKFKSRHGIKSYRRFGESGSVDMHDMENKLESIREKIDQFPRKDVFNMDETGLFYRLQADHSLATKQLEGRKQDKERLTIVICCNEDGSEKIPLWIIGKYAKPRCFKNVNMNSLNCQYCANKRAWMTGVLFEEYVRWLDEQMHGRKILLVVDNCPAHSNNIQGLRNIELFFLPPNMTSKIQPCDAGIIRAFKMYYRKRFYRKILEGYELDIPSPEKINVLDVINMAVSAWTENVHQEAIANCFRHCKIRSENQSDSSANDATPGEDIRELENLITGMQYHHKMDVNQLLDFPGENNQCHEVQSLEEIVADVIHNPEDDEAEDDSIALEPVTLKEALQASTTLHNFLLQYEKTTPQLLGAVRRFKDEINIDLKFKKKQVTVDSYFTKLS